MASIKSELRIAAVGDLHCRKESQGLLQPIFASIGDRADILLLCGDLCDYGTVEEAIILVKEITSVVKIPILAVLGNHDVESGAEVDISKILTDGGITLLDGTAVEIGGVGFAGVKGFCGGFGRRTLEPWGEAVVKRFVREAIEEALKLDSALAKLRTRVRIAVLHYAPLEATVEGEPREIYPFLGSSRLEDPIDRHEVTAVFHGHAHRGSLEGRTRGGVPVYNVAMPLLKRSFPDKSPFQFVTIPTMLDEPAAVNASPATGADGSVTAAPSS